MENKLIFATLGTAFAVVSHRVKRWLDFDATVTRYTLPDDRWRGQGDLRIALVSDFHGGSDMWSGKSLAKVVLKEKVDLVCVTGDHFDPDQYGVESFGFLEEIAKHHPVYFVTGNNEEKLPVKNVLNIIRRYGVHVLNNEMQRVPVRGAMVDILGLRDYAAFAGKEEWRWEIQQSLKKVEDNGHYHIVLCHRPEMVDLFRELKAHVVLSGHAHGGQWCVGKRQGIFAPGQGFFPKYTKGIYQIGKKEKMHLIVSTGFSVETWIPRIRNKPELVIIDIKACQ